MQLAARHMQEGVTLEKKTPRESPFIAVKEPSTPPAIVKKQEPEALKEELIKAEHSTELRAEEPAPQALHSAQEVNEVKPVLIEETPATADRQVIEPKSEVSSEAPEQAEVPQMDRVEAKPAVSRKRRKSSAFSLNEMEDAHDIQSQEKVEDVASDHKAEIDLTQLLAAWKAYADKMHEMGKFSFYSTLMNNQPEVLDDRRIKITLENEVQESDLNMEKADLMSFIRNELAHPGLVLESEIDIEDKGNIGFRTPKEQFQEMADKNPNLRKLTKQFDLDLEY
jgi:DNA polymerase-3 subunit gamma/tau